MCCTLKLSLSLSVSLFSFSLILYLCNRSHAPQVASLLSSSAMDWAALSTLLTKPLRPLWVTASTQFIAGDLPQPATFPFLPVVCLSVALPVDTCAMHGFLYLQGAADDEEAWARGLTAREFWMHQHVLLAAAAARDCERLMDAIVGEREAREAQGAAGEERAESASAACYSRLGSTNIFVGSRRAARPPQCWMHFDAILNCTMEEYSQDGRPAAARYMHMPVPEGKKARRELETQMAAALGFAEAALRGGCRLLIHCNQGMDR